MSACLPQPDLTSRELVDLVAAQGASSAARSGWRRAARRASISTPSRWCSTPTARCSSAGRSSTGCAALGPLPDAVGGMSIGADPVTGAVVTMAGVAGLPLKGFMVRKEPKDHGLQKYIEGPVEPGQRVVIVEDVVTTGGSSLLAIERAQEFGLVVERVVAVIDRLAGAEAAFAAQGIPLESLVTIRDLGIEPGET